jgi:MATE family multidrug resistance protein
MLGVMELLAVPGSAIAGLLRGRKNARVPMLASLMGYWVVGAPLGLWLSAAEGHGVAGVWTGLVVGTAATTVVLLATVLSGRSCRS